MRQIKSGTNWVVYALCTIIYLSSCNNRSSETPQILIFSKTAEYYHPSIKKGNEALLQLGKEYGFSVDTTTNGNYFMDDSLRKYASVVFLNTTGDVLDHRQEAALERYVQAGGGIAGIHSASDTEPNWRWFGRMFNNNLPEKLPVQQVSAVPESSHTTGQSAENRIEKDGCYILKNSDKELLKVHQNGALSANQLSFASAHEYDGGRVFYTGLGHKEAPFSDSLFLQHIVNGIQYTIGSNKQLDYSKAKTQNVPEDERLIKTVLTEGTLKEPTEMTILPNLDVLISERRGGIVLYKNNTGEVKQVGKLDVYASSDFGGNVEEGLLGIAADPQFEKNNHVFVFYSPADTSVNRLSRFIFKNDQLDLSTEKIILQFYSRRQMCCHTGGSIAFGPEGLLFVSTGDNSTPFNEPNQRYINNGYAPLDDRAGHEPYDARRSAGNSNDLRGKILRIKVKDNGDYEIPAGNLFPQDNPLTRPEIYVMGNRNPFRISVDQKNGFLYWGEVGPDANVDSLQTRGPRGYDEINQARGPGFFGWPLFVGNNYPYKSYNYANGQSGEFFNPEHPINSSRNNTGIEELPPAQPPMIWYPYNHTEDFPEVGAGGRTAMAGPVYYTDQFPEKNRYPDYFNGKFFFYDWVRNWIKVATFFPNGDLNKIEPFADHLSFAAPMDMEVGPDGRLYVLAYGQGWFTNNSDAGLSRIDYLAGNLPPKIEQLTIDKTTGNLPLTITAQVAVSDAENDQLTYTWFVGSQEITTRVPEMQFTLQTAGEHAVSVIVKDAKGASAKSSPVAVYAGNEKPVVKIALQGNQNFYFPEKPVQYQVTVKDEGEEVALENLYISSDQIESKDLAGASKGHQQVSEAAMGKNIMLTLDCKACHKIDGKSVGPSYRSVAEKYFEDPKGLNYLSEKIISGGSGVWSEKNMPAHPSLKNGEAEKIVKWIFSLAQESAPRASLPADGEIAPAFIRSADPAAILRISATYTDKGEVGIRPLSGADVVYLRSSIMSINDLEEIEGFEKLDNPKGNFLMFPQTSGWFLAGKLDMTGVRALELSGFGKTAEGSYQLEVRRGKNDGKKIGQVVIDLPFDKAERSILIPIEQELMEDSADIYIRVEALNPGGKAFFSHLEFIPEVTLQQ